MNQAALPKKQPGLQWVWLPLLVLAIGLLTTYLLWRDVRATAQKSHQLDFEYLAADIHDRILQRMIDYDQVLQSLRGFFDASNSVERDEFRDFYKSLHLPEHYPGIHALAYIPLVKLADKQQFVGEVRKQGFPGFDIFPRGVRESYSPVYYIEPFSGSNLRAFGYDIASNPIRREAMERARDTDTTTVTEKIELVQDDGAQFTPAFLMILPVYRRGAPHDTLEARKANLIGWVDMVFHAENLIMDALGKNGAELEIKVYDGEEISEQSLIFSQTRDHHQTHSQALLHSRQKVVVGGRTWTLLVSTLPKFEQRLNTGKSQYVLVGGLFASLMLALLTQVLVRGRLNSLRAAHALSQELQARKQAEESLRQAALVYESSTEGMLVTDERNRIIAVNPAFTRITGFTLEDVYGKDPSFMASDQHNEGIYKAMWSELNRTGRWQGEIWDRRKNGEIHPKYLTINTIYDDKGAVYRRVALFLDITAQKESEEFIWRQANFDSLTGLPNRSMFHDRLEQEVKKSHRANLIFALLFIDLDLFKEVNDTLGHAMGDQLLIEAGKRISSCVREEDTVARLGGDEFTVILNELHDPDNVERVTSLILEKLTAPYKLGEEIVHITGSIGVTLYPRDATDADSLLKNADQAMYVAKNMGRNRSSYFTPALQEAAQNRLRLINDLRTAIAQQQFSVHYQPIIDLKGGGVCKAEALVRWQHPVRGLVSPDDFIPLAEETGLISNIGTWVFHESAQMVKHLRESYCPDFQISVNKSPQQFREANDTFTEWFDCLHRLELNGNSIVIEITEGLLLNAVAEVTDRLAAFRTAGIQIAIDDFGTGYSSLAYLKRFNIDYLKIDRTFVRDIETDTNDLALSKAIILLAHELGLKVIAEGVETELQLRLLTEAGCDYAQGYYFAKPLPAEAFEALLRSSEAKSWRQRFGNA